MVVQSVTVAHKQKRADVSIGALGVFVVAYLTLTSLISNWTATFGGNGVRGSAP